ncbi:MAG: glycosyltransferase family 4 protein [Ktedonobacterales bacterium]|nr:glycosyltransferase family 4 protein [Ktedonobacterales bacterium]
MRIAQIAPLQVAVPPRQYGGTERLIHNLTETLVQLGHDVTLFASGDSQTSANLIAPVPAAFNFNPAVDVRAYQMAMLAEVYRQVDRFDIIHSHLDYYALPFAEHSATPTVTTLHGRLDLPEYERVYYAYRGMPYISISKSQQSQLPEMNWVGTVHHSVDVSKFKFYPEVGDYLAFVGRISPEKRPDRAIEIAKMTGIPLKIAAKVDPADRPYFEEVIKPLMQHPLIEFLGEVDEMGKREVMGNALALLMPIDWPEPFGIVFIEALACGTPVLTCPCGSVPELLQDGVTGYIRRSVEELAEAALKVHDISRAACRRFAATRYDNRRLARDYLRLYDKIIRMHRLHPQDAEAAIDEGADTEATIIEQLPALAVSDVGYTAPLTRRGPGPGIPLPDDYAINDDESVLLA